MDIWAYNCTIDFLQGQKYKILKEKHEFKYCWYCNLQNMHNVIPGCEIIDFHWKLLSNNKGKHNRCITDGPARQPAEYLPNSEG